jgi:DNA-directed RNA polymerase subunit RPC12/RpoP
MYKGCGDMTALKDCPACGGKIAKDADTCPHCGHKIGDKILITVSFLFMVPVAIFIIWAVVSCGNAIFYTGK